MGAQLNTTPTHMRTVDEMSRPQDELPGYSVALRMAGSGTKDRCPSSAATPPAVGGDGNGQTEDNAGPWRVIHGFMHPTGPMKGSSNASGVVTRRMRHVSDGLKGHLKPPFNGAARFSWCVTSPSAWPSRCSHTHTRTGHGSPPVVTVWFAGAIKGGCRFGR